MFTKIALLCVAVFAAVQAGPLTGRVVGGHEAEKGQFPFQLSLQYGFSFLRTHVCGASILNSRWALTAGHCITELPHFPFTHFYVVAGLHSLKDHGQMIKVKRTIVHPDYEGKVNPNDIALLELEHDLILGDNVKAVDLPEKDAIPSGESTLSGWGSTSTGMIPIMPKKLQTVNLPVISHEACAAALTTVLGTAEPLRESNVCTGPLEGKLGACSGDSGGPLITTDSNVLIGIVSWGIIPCGSKGAPSVFTRVSAFNDWINEKING